MSEPRRLYRDTQKAVFGGVAAGLAEYANMDLVLVRVLWVVGFILTGLFPGVLIYAVLWIMVPPKPPGEVPPPVQQS